MKLIRTDLILNATHNTLYFPHTQIQLDNTYETNQSLLQIIINEIVLISFPLNTICSCTWGLARLTFITFPLNFGLYDTCMPTNGQTERHRDALYIMCTGHAKLNPKNNVAKTNKIVYLIYSVSSLSSSQL